MANTFRVVESSDVAQEIWVSLHRNWNALKGKDDGYLRQAAKRAGALYCERERYDFTFNTAQFVYTTNEVRGLLSEAFFEDAGWLDAPRKEFGNVEGGVLAGGLAVALWDLRSAYEALKPHEATAIRKRYTTPDPLTDVERQHVTRGVDSMAVLLNKALARRDSQRYDHEGPGARRAMSNAQAQAMTKATF